MPINQDEGHRVKRADCKLAVQLQYYRVQHRLLLTGMCVCVVYVCIAPPPTRRPRIIRYTHAGTPVHNNLMELWSLLNFIMPDMFGNAQEFDEWCVCKGRADTVAKPQPSCPSARRFGNLMHRLDEHATPLSEEEQLLVTNRLHQVLCPFMLRRLKQDVLGDKLPRKVGTWKMWWSIVYVHTPYHYRNLQVEYVLQCPMSVYQQHLCSLVHQRLQRAAPSNTLTDTSATANTDDSIAPRVTRARACPAVDQAAPKGKVISINNAVMELRTICNHPLVR